jgi:succinyl-diaminopimelate desuccinylase
MQNILNLTKQLVSIPSWVNGSTNEIKLADFIFDYLKDNSTLKLTKQLVVDGRYNIFASNNEDIQTLIIGHTDTVGVDLNDWNTPPTTPVIKAGRLYGRGTTDMKSGLAAMMLLACQDKLPSNTGFLFYIDEEYSFLGMKKFIADYGDTIKPNKIISLDGSELEISNGCRGLIEIEIEITGASCHAATPKNGINAINASITLCQELEKQIKIPVNIGLIKGGSAPNVVAEKCLFTIDIRPDDQNLTADVVKQRVLDIARELKVTVSRLTINYDFGSWTTPISSIPSLGLPFKNITESGYIDIQLLWEKFNRPICFTIGAGCQKMAHSANEYVEVDKLTKLPQILTDIINNI